MTHELTLKHGEAPNAIAAAWFLSGEDVDRWIEELVCSGLADMTTQLFLVSRSAKDPACAGVLVVPMRADSAQPPPRGLACRLIADRMFVPLDGVLYPPVTDSEVKSLCLLPVYFFHPVFGLSGFDERAALRVSDLIALPEIYPGEWNSARPGVPALPALEGIVMLDPPSIDDIFGDAKEEIGSEPPEALPPTPGEPTESSTAKAGRRLRRIFMGGVSGAIKYMPHTARSRTWLNDVEDWANQSLRGMNAELEKMRNKEIHRLLHMFESDPEAALRHAIPMNAFAHRGTAPPSARLGSHSLNFDPRRLGGGASDFWNVPAQLQEILRRRYREMADREMQLGRHRRAAYIYAQLLGDLVSAANAFKRGGFFREAALLYEEHLKNPLEAARCLAEGGFLAEAIERYEKLGCWLEVAELHKRAGNPAAAENAIRRVVNERLEQGDFLGAAKLVDEKLQASEEALEMLFRAWPESRQAVNCITAAFQILARLGRHEVALEQVAKFGRETPYPSLAQPLIGMLVATAREYPHDLVRHRAADLSRILIAGQLKKTSLPIDEMGRLLTHLARLAPDDRLLSRDSNRYLADRRSKELKTRKIAPPPLPGNKPVLHKRFELPRQIHWLQLRKEWHWFYALGVTAKRITVLRGIWEGEYQSLSWECSADVLKQGFVFEPTAEQGKALAVAPLGGPPLGQKRFPASDQFFNIACNAGTPSWLPTQGFHFAMGEDSVWSGHIANGRAILSCHDKIRGQLLRTLDITDDLLQGAKRESNTRVSMTALANGIAVALGNRLVLTRPDGVTTKVELPGQAIRIFATIPHTRQGVAVMLQNGAVMFWVGANSYIELDRDIQSPIGTFVPGGPLVLISGMQAILLEVDSRGVKNVTRLKLTCQHAVAVSSTANPGEFAVLGDQGEVTLYRMPR